MIACQEVTDANIVEFVVEGEITKEGFDQTLETLNNAINEHGKIRMLEQIHAFKGIPISRIWDDVKFSYQHARDITHVAVVADARWIEILTNCATPLMTAKVRHFELSEIEQARQWLRTAAE